MGTSAITNWRIKSNRTSGRNVFSLFLLLLILLQLAFSSPGQPTETGWFDGFENYPSSAFPSSNWTFSGNGDIQVDNAVPTSGSQSVRLHGLVGGCWAALLHRGLSVSPPFTLEFQTRNGSETMTGCHQLRSTLFLHTGPSWTSSLRSLIIFDGAGKINGSFGVLGTYVSNQWYKVKIAYERIDASSVRLTYWIDNQFKGSGLAPAFSYESQLAYLSPQAAEGTAWFDDIRITPGTPATLQFSAASYTVNEEAGGATITLTRTGDTSSATTLDYSTSDANGSFNFVECNVNNGLANQRCDYISSIGTLRFAAGETSKTITILIVDDAYAEGNEMFSLTLSNPTGASLGTPASATVTITDNDTVTGPNPIDQASFFVQQHYLDFLNRQPDAAGLAFWTSEFTSCGTDAQCIEIKRINVSAAFFLSIEFQETGFLVYRMYKAAYGDTTSPNVAIPVPIIRLNEFLPDAQRISQGVQVGIGDWQTQLENNKTAYAREFVVTQRFLTAYPLTMTPTQFVDKLNLTAGGVLSATKRQQLIDELTAATDVTQGRASVTRKVAEDADLRQQETNRAFVLMQYYGYLRRNPDDPRDTDFRGWEFWLDKLNQFNGNFIQAEMVKAFIFSTEYRQRFGQP